MARAVFGGGVLLEFIETDSIVVSPVDVHCPSRCVEAS
jgi:hypothetical protein